MAEPVELLEGLATTRAIRRYLPDPIPEDDLAKLAFAASRAPTGSNRQSYRMLFLRDGPKAIEARRALARAARHVWGDKREADGYGGAAADSPKARMARTMEHFVEHFGDAPLIVLPCLVRYREPTPTEGASIYPVCQNLLLAARALGYGGVITGWHRYVEDELHEILGIPDDVLIAAAIPIGKPAGRHGPVRRRPLSELVYEDAWGGAADWAVDPVDARFTSAGPPKH